MKDQEFHEVQITFQYIMKFLYNGGPAAIEFNPADILELMGAANFFLLEGLQRHCEILCAKRLNFDNCMSIYKHAKVIFFVDKSLENGYTQPTV